jgi:hypothetical protein
MPNGTAQIISFPKAARSRLIFNEAQRIGDWAKARIPNYVGWAGHYQAIGLERDGELKCAVIYTSASPTNVVVSAVFEAPPTRKFFHVVMWYPFVQLKVRRLTAFVEASNKRSFDFCTHFGFVVEGRMRAAAADGGDVILMGLVKEEARYL